MANAQKFAKTATGHLAAHFERKQLPVVKEDGSTVMEYVRFGNQDIDLTRTHLNYNLAPDRSEGQSGFIRRRCSEAHCMQRADVNVMVSWVVTLPTHTEKGQALTYTEEQQRAFFQESYAMLADRYGRENVISAYVHLDEVTPHLHFAFVPVIEDRNWNKKHPDRPRDKVSAKEVLTRTDLQTFHPDLQKHLDQRCGEGLFPVLNGATEGGNRSIVELKAARATAELAKVENQLADAYRELEETEDLVQRAESDLQDRLDEAFEVGICTAESRSQAAAAEEEVATLTAKIQELQPRSAALEDDVAALEARREDLQGQIEGLRGQLEDLTAAMQRKTQNARLQFGSERDLQLQIQAVRAEKEKEKRLEALEIVAAATPENQQLLQEVLRIMKQRDKRKNQTYQNYER